MSFATLLTENLSYFILYSSTFIAEIIFKKGNEAMIKKYLAMTLISVGLLSALPGCQGSGNDIGQDEASKIALEDAGTTEDAVSRFLVSQDQDDGRKIYEVQFSYDGTEYDYEISADTGEIISASKEADDNSLSSPTATPAAAAEPTQTPEMTPTAAPAQDTQTTQAPSAQTGLSVEEASQLVLDRVPGATTDDLRIELDEDDGRYKYEGEVIYNQVEYDFEMDANTGNFLEWEEDHH